MNAPTIVTAYYRIPSKHTDAEYDVWLKTFAETLENPVVFFGEAEWCRWFAQIRGNKPTCCIIQPFKELPCQTMTDWEAVWRDDKFKHLHSTELYVVWNQKPWFVSRAIARNPFQSQSDGAFAWVDIGCFREPEKAKQFVRWPLSERLRTADMNRIHIAQVEPYLPDDCVIGADGLPADFHGTNRLSGAMLVGNRDAWRRYVPAYYDMVNRFIATGRNCGLEQNAISALALAQPDLFHLVQPPEGVNKWFYLQEYFA